MEQPFIPLPHKDMQSDFSPLPISDRSLHQWAECLLEKPKVLQDIVLIPVPQSLLSLPYEARRRSPTVQKTLNEWERQIREDDLCFGFEERCWIPRVEIYIPNTPHGQQLIQIATEIGKIPLLAGIVPKNQEQAYWLKTLHYFYQARGILFAYKLLRGIPNPSSTKGVFQQYFSTSIIRNLKLVNEVDIAEYQLISAGEPYLKSWMAGRQQPYPFQDPLQLFLEIEKQAFLQGWELGPNNAGDWVSIEDQKDLLSVRVFLLQQFQWTEFKRIEKRGTYKEQERRYLKFLQKNGWYGRFILALRSHGEPNLEALRFHNGPKLEEPWRQYVEALRDSKIAYIDDFYWRKGLPYKRKENTVEPKPIPCSSIPPDQCNCPFRSLGTDLSASNCLKLLQEATKKTAERARVKGSLNSLGYLLWLWA
ncbi:hypothetical protein H6F88_00780 [Oculatella sp. FACHB-28]|uniref:hypothetical protein n=1 Tax=Oculatella sp. FACHB-28 TaxID=2692845 RepID=UPI001684E77E|nr:hypothetical protein [Oculatella sp. FACHB-28]MBD2054577.1 hypothetical protein [Oculatella sp. FACHB-28]